MSRRFVRPTTSEDVGRRSPRPRRGERSGGSRSSAVYRRAAPTRQRVVQHVLLRDDGDVFLEGLEVGVQVLAVDRHGPGVGRVPAAEDRQQGRLARPARPEQADELPGRIDQADVVEQRQRLAGRPVLDHAPQPAGGSSMLFDRDRLTRPVPSNWRENGPMSMRSPGSRVGRPGEPPAVDERAVGAAEVGEHDPTAVRPPGWRAAARRGGGRGDTGPIPSSRPITPPPPTSNRSELWPSRGARPDAGRRPGPSARSRRATGARRPSSDIPGKSPGVRPPRPPSSRRARSSCTSEGSGHSDAPAMRFPFTQSPGPPGPLPRSVVARQDESLRSPDRRPRPRRIDSNARV